MKKYLAVFFAVLLTVSLCACKSNTETSSNGSDLSSVSGVTLQNSSTPALNASAESNASVNSGANTTSTSSPETLPVTSSPIKFALVEDTISVIGNKTYADIKALYGEPCDVFYDDMDSAVYKFKNSDTWYGFYDLNFSSPIVDGAWPDVPTDKNGKWIFEKAPLPKDTAVVNSVYYLSIEDILTGVNENVDVIDLEEFSNMELQANYYDSQRKCYICAYLYNNIYILVESDSEYQIMPDSKIIYMKDYDDLI